VAKRSEVVAVEALRAENRALRNAIGLLHRVASLVAAPPELEATCYALLTGVTAGVGLGLNRAMLFVCDESDRDVLRGYAAVGPADRLEADRVWKTIEAEEPDLTTLYQAGLRQRTQPGELDRRVRQTRIVVTADNPVALALRRGELVHGIGDDLDGLLHLPTAVAAPLRGPRSVHGVLCADNAFTGRRLDPPTELVFGLIAEYAGTALESAHHFEQLAAEARTDALTGLGHHGTLMDDLARAAGAVADGSLGLVMVDLDDFKQVNDTHGHLAGDALLAEVAERMRAAARQGEAPYRYGGEEFALILRDADTATAAEVADRIRHTIADRPFPVGDRHALTVTCSLGVASLPADASDPHALVAAADDALLRAKAAGKNRVERT